MAVAHWERCPYTQTVWNVLAIVQYVCAIQHPWITNGHSGVARLGIRGRVQPIKRDGVMMTLCILNLMRSMCRSIWTSFTLTFVAGFVCVCASNTSTVCVPFMIAPFAPRLAYSLFSCVTIKRKMKTKKEQKKHRPPSSSYGRMLNINLKWSNLCASIVSFVHRNVDGTGHTQKATVLCVWGDRNA